MKTIKSLIYFSKLSASTSFHLIMIVGQAPPHLMSLALIERHFLHIMFENLTRSPATLNSLNLPCVPASKLQSH